MSVHEFNQLGAPVGHVRCKLHILDGDGRNFQCQCGEHFATRDDLVEHANKHARLLATVLK